MRPHLRPLRAGPALRFPRTPERDYNAICSLLQRALADRSKTITYSFDIKEIIVSGDMAIVRLVWTSKVSREGSAQVTRPRSPDWTCSVGSPTANGGSRVIWRMKRRDGVVMGKEFWKSACPHDCPSACSLEVERLSSTRIGRIRGAAANTYTDGVVCAKVARYAERVHHPDRLKQPLQRSARRARASFGRSPGTTP
jgi:hypothetical protein